MLNLENISLKYGHETAIKNLSLSVEFGDKIGIIGPSGCGKTSLLYAIAGLRSLHQGSIKRCYANSDCGIMFQDDRLLPWLSVRENIELGLPEKKTRSDSSHEELYSMLGLQNQLGKYPTQLSGGQRQRAALARMLIRKPGLMLLDEPFAALDEQSRENLQQELLEYLQRYNSTLILVTHSIAEAVFLGSRIIVMKQAGIFHEVRNSCHLQTHARDTDEFYEGVKYIRSKLKQAMQCNTRSPL
ncbi:ABC transporter ATP-binding protein [Spirochaeta dissipatitropha]